MRIPRILFDLDGTLADYDAAVFAELNLIRHPSEKVFDGSEALHDLCEHNSYIDHRRRLITSPEDFWTNLHVMPDGYSMFRWFAANGCKIDIATCGPSSKPFAWSGKIRWVQKNIGNNDVHITRNKALIDGDILVDDYPSYVGPWLEANPKRFAILPRRKYNSNFVHERAKVMSPDEFAAAVESGYMDGILAGFRS